MKSLKKLALSGVTLAALAMTSQIPAKAETATTAITTTTNVINVVLAISSIFHYGTIKW